MFTYIYKDKIHMIEKVAKRIYAEIMWHWDMHGRDLPVWAETSESHRQMTIASVIRLLNYPGEITPEKGHYLWAVDAYRRGWRQGDEFNAFAKPFPTNPRLIPFPCMNKADQEVSDIVTSIFREYKDRFVKYYNLYIPEPDENDFSFSNNRIGMQVFNLK